MPDTTLPDGTLKKLASQARLKPVSDIKQEIPDWDWGDEYALSVLDRRLAPIDDAWVEESERKKANATKLPQLSHDRQWWIDRQQVFLRIGQRSPKGVTLWYSIVTLQSGH
jgi:hypothetical protein